MDKGQRCCEVDGEKELGEKQSSCRGWMMYSKKDGPICLHYFSFWAEYAVDRDTRIMNA